MILQIDVTVTGPDQVMTGSATVTVSQPAAQAAPPDAPGELAGMRRRQRVQAMMRRKR